MSVLSRHSSRPQRRGLIAHSIAVAGIFTALLIGGIPCAAAHAADGAPQFALQPVTYDPSMPATKSYFIFDSATSAVIHSRVRVTNSGTAAGTVKLYPVDATTGQTSGLVYLSGQDPRRDVGAWVKLTAQQATLAPRQSQIVDFVVTVPDDARAGQHVGGIVAENMEVQSTQASGAIQVRVQNLTIVAVQVDIPGPAVEQLEATGIEAGGENGYQSLSVGLRNAGTVMLKPSGTLTVRDAEGHAVQQIALHLDSFLPGTAINYPVPITGPALLAGTYTGDLSLTYGTRQALAYSAHFAVTSQQLAQVFGSHATTPPPVGGSSMGQTIIIGLLVVAVAILLRLWGFRDLRGLRRSKNS